MAIAERYWNNFLNQGLGEKPRWYQQVDFTRPKDVWQDFSTHPRVEAIRGFTATQFRKWWDNTSPWRLVNKDLVWWAGASLGVATSLLFSQYVAHNTPETRMLLGITKSLVTAGTFQLAYIGSEIVHNNRRLQIISQYSGAADLTQRLQDLEDDRTSWQSAIERSMKGFGAGGFYGGLGRGMELGVEHFSGFRLIDPIRTSGLGALAKGVGPAKDATGEALGATFNKVGTFFHNLTGWGVDHTPAATPISTPIRVPTAVPRPTVTEVPATVVPTQVPTVEPTRIPTAVPTTVPTVEPTPSLPGVVDVGRLMEVKLQAVEANPAINADMLAQATQKLVANQDRLINDAAYAAGKSLKDLSPGTITAARQTLQQALNNQARVALDQAAKAYISSDPNMDPGSPAALQAIQGSARVQLEAWFSNAEAQDKLAGVALLTIKDQLNLAQMGKVTTEVARFVAENQNKTDVLIDHVVTKGETAGHMLLKMGTIPTWDGHDWEAFAVLRALNPDAFAELQKAMNLTPEQFEQLILRIKSGDMGAYQTLIKFMGRIEVGRHITMLSPQAMQTLLSRVR